MVDVEATCWDQPRPRERTEIIEIGAVRIGGDLAVVDEFASFVRPVVEPKLSAFCTDLTSITQTDVDAADPFSMVFRSFLDWIGEGDRRLCSWGFYDVGQFQLDCARHGMVFPDDFEARHLNLKTEFAAWQRIKRCGLAAALAHLEVPLVGTHHRAIDDARNTATIARRFLADHPVGRARPVP